MYILNITNTINNLQLLFNETSEKKDLQSFATKLIEKVPDPNKTKKYYQSYLVKHNR